MVRLHTLNKLDNQTVMILWVICIIIFLIEVNLELINSEMEVTGAY